MFSLSPFTMHHPKSSRGFTLVELLVVITIIGILIALLLPAVQAAREAARRAQCSNNLKQLGLAMHLHVEAKGTFPAGHIWPAGSTGNEAGDEATWFAFLLPYMEQNNLYDKIQWDKGFGFANGPGTPQYEVVSTQLAAFTCPSNGPVERVGSHVRGNYAANNGFGPMAESQAADLPIKRQMQVQVGATTVTVTGAKLAGVFYLNSSMPPAEIADGLSNTALVSEIRTVPGLDYRGLVYYPDGCLYHHNYTPNSSTPDGLRDYACVNVPEAPCIGTYSGWSPRAITMTARSAHPGGIHLLLGDGSARFVGDSVALNVWRALCTPSALPGEQVGGDF